MCGRIVLPISMLHRIQPRIGCELGRAPPIPVFAEDNSNPKNGPPHPAQTLHFNGRHAEATDLAQEVIAGAWRTIPLAYNPSPIELRVWMRIVLARIWRMRGFPDRAAAMAREAMEQARTDSPLAECHRREGGRTAEARALLAPVFDRFTEGLGTRALLEARRVLEALQPAARLTTESSGSPSA